MKRITRRGFLETSIKIGVGLAGTLYLPNIVYGKNTYETNDFSDDSDQVILARMIFGEARSSFKLNDDYLEPTMIGFTAINRVRDRIKTNGQTLKEVLLRNDKIKNKKRKEITVYQYSCFDPKDKNFKKIKDPEKYDKDSWKKSLTVSRRLLTIENELAHLNYSQSHYHGKEMEKFPYWSKSERMEKIWVPPYFEHYFYKDTKA